MPIELQDVSKRFGEKRVLEDFSLSLADEGVTALLGPSGCGKTTLLRLCAGLTRPDRGAVVLPGGCKVSMVFQEDRLLPALNALGNVQAVITGPGGGELARECLEGVGLGEATGQYPEALSGGMRRRVAIARAVAYGGDLLLLDEAFKGLDPAAKEQVMRFVLRGPRRARASLLVTHDLDEALDAADRVLVARGLPMRIVGELDRDRRGPKGDPAARAEERAALLALLGGEGAG